jgi:hypothetical protein
MALYIAIRTAHSVIPTVSFAILLVNKEDVMSDSNDETEIAYDEWYQYKLMQARIPEEKKISSSSKVPVGKLIRTSPAMPIAGYIKVVFEDGSIKRSPVRTDKQILSMEFEPARDSCPWDYDNPDGDAVFND